MDNAIFYTLADDKRYYKDYTGTGNTINANHPVVRDHILSKEKQLACLIQEGDQRALCLMFNAGGDAVDFGLPPAPSGAPWRLTVDTSREASEGLFAAGDEPPCEDPFSYHLSSRSSAVLVARQAEIE